MYFPKAESTNIHGPEVYQNRYIQPQSSFNIANVMHNSSSTGRMKLALAAIAMFGVITA